MRVRIHELSRSQVDPPSVCPSDDRNVRRFTGFLVPDLDLPACTSECGTQSQSEGHKPPRRFCSSLRPRRYSTASSQYMSCSSGRQYRTFWKIALDRVPAASVLLSLTVPRLHHSLAFTATAVRAGDQPISNCFRKILGAGIRVVGRE